MACTAGRNFVSFILLHLKAVIYARVEVKRNATEQRRERARGGSGRGPEESEKRRTRKRNKRRYCNRYVSMQTLSFIRLPVYGSGGDVSGVCAGVRGTRVTVASDCRGDRADENSSYRIGMRRDGEQANADTERQPAALRPQRRRRNEEGGSRRRVVAFLASSRRGTATNGRPTRGFSRERAKRAYEQVRNECSMNTSLGPREVNVWRRREGGTVVGRTVSRRVWRGVGGGDEVVGTVATRSVAAAAAVSVAMSVLCVGAVGAGKGTGSAR